MTIPGWRSPHGGDYDSWLEQRRDQVVERVHAEIGRCVGSPEQAALLRRAVDAYSGVTTPGPRAWQPHVHYPLLVAAGICGDDSPALPIATVGLMVRIGTKLYDDLSDGDLSEAWSDVPEFAIINTALALFSVIPPATLASLDWPDGGQASAHAALAEGILHMLAGQTTDLLLKNRADIDTAAIEETAVGKSGWGLALLTGLAAQAAGAPPDVVRAYREYGRSRGAAMLFLQDFNEMFRDPARRDLVQGTRTLQIALCLNGLDEPRRAEFLELLSEARTQAAAQDAVRAELRQVGHVRALLQVVNRYLTQARDAIDEAGTPEPIRTHLLSGLEPRAPML